MSDIYKGELQDNEGNTIYPHTEADVVFLADGTSMQDKMNAVDENLGTVNGQLTASGKSFRFGITADGEYGYHKEVDGADTVIPFKSGIDLSKAIEMFSCTKPYGTYVLYTAPEDGYYFAHSSHMDNDNTVLTCPEGVTTIRYNHNSDSSRACILYYGEIKAGQTITCFFGNNNRTAVQGIFIPK